MLLHSNKESTTDIFLNNDTILKDALKKYKVDIIEINNEDEYEKPLFNFFLKRKKQLSR